MEFMAAIKFLAFYALEVFVVGVVAATVIAGLYELVRDQVRSSLSEVRESRVPAPSLVHERYDR